MDSADLERLLAVAPLELIERIRCRYCTASALRDRRLAQQDAAYRELAAGVSESSGYANRTGADHLA